MVIADDHALVREGTKHILEREGDIQVVGEAADGLEAVRLVEAVRPNVVLMDIAMPRLNGIEATRSIKERCPEVAVLVLTVHDDDQYVHALLEAGAAGYLIKDVPGRRLVEAIRAVHAGESILHGAVARKVLGRLLGSREGTSRPVREPLTGRELEVLKLAASGLSNKEIAAALGLSVRTVQTHLGHIFGKLGVASRTEAVIRGLREGWFRLEEVG